MKKKYLKIGIIALCVCVAAICAILFFKKETSTISSETTDLGFKDIGELSTQECDITIVETSESGKRLFGKESKLFKSSFIFSYDAFVKAGIDFAAIDVNIDNAAKTVTVKMPEARILDVSIDNDSLQIYSEKSNIFNPITIEDVNTAQKDLKEKAVSDAKNKGILEKAEANAKVLINNFVKSSSNLKDYTVFVQ